MSGEDERSRRPAPGETPRPAAGANPFLEEAPPGAPPAKVKRGKPPPGIISAGGVDMARAHASNIRPLADSDQKPMEQAKVVLSAEKTDPRRMRTMRRIDMKPGESGFPPGAGGDSPWAQKGGEVLDKAALPSANIPREAAPAGAQEKKDDRAAAPPWIRWAAVLVVLLLIAGVSKRIYMSTKRTGPAPTPYNGNPLIPEPLPPDPTTADTSEPSPTGRVVGVRGPGPAPTDTAAVDSSAEPPLEFTTEPTVPAVRVRPPPPPPPPKPTFTPLFQLPDEKKN